VGDPLLVLADEPTGNLDTKQGEVILVLLRALASQRGRAVVVVTHDARAAERCDRALELRDGCVVQAEGIEDRKVAMAVGAARS
jgi:putative ABC transport system ATP-binding protein